MPTFAHFFYGINKQKWPWPNDPVVKLLGITLCKVRYFTQTRIHRIPFMLFTGFAKTLTPYFPFFPAIDLQRVAYTWYKRRCIKCEEHEDEIKMNVKENHVTKKKIQLNSTHRYYSIHTILLIFSFFYITLKLKHVLRSYSWKTVKSSLYCFVIVIVTHDRYQSIARTINNQHACDRLLISNSIISITIHLCSQINNLVFSCTTLRNVCIHARNACN